MTPHLYMTNESVAGLRSVADVRRGLEHPHSQAIWQSVRQGHRADCGAEPHEPTSVIPNRSVEQARVGNRDYNIVGASCSRLLRGAFLACIEDDAAYLDAARRQLACVFDDARWPDWRDLAHLGAPVDLRHGQFSRAIGLAYDWAYAYWTPAEREWIVAEMDRRAIQPYFAAIEQGAWFTRGPHLNNWHTVICGGFGVLGMALGAAHPRSAEMIAYADGIMDQHAAMFGPEGESNESPGYSGATRIPVDYYNARRCHDVSAGRPSAQRLSGHPYQATCHWMIHQLAPPGRMVAYGDTHHDHQTKQTFFAAVADATADRSIQAAFLHMCEVAGGTHGEVGGDAAIMDLLFFNPDVIPADEEPAVTLPLGKAYHGESACISSRSSWNLSPGPRLVVFGKGGHGSEGHGNHDAGQLVIDGSGERLITDPGIPSGGYPADFFGENRYKYYNASVFGHNIFMFGEREMRVGREHAATITHATFDPDRLGGAWQVETTALYDDVRRVRRSVIHCGDVVAVLDEAELSGATDISMRWHTVDRCEADADGRFTVQGERVRLLSRIQRLDAPALALATRRHAYAAPYHQNRIGVPLNDVGESYIDATCHADRCRLLTLFAVTGPAQAQVDSWQRDADTHAIRAGDALTDRYTVRVTDDSFVLTCTRADATWRLAL